MLKLFSVLNKELLTIGGSSNDIKIRIYSVNDPVSNATYIGQCNASLYIVTPCNIPPYVGIGTVSPLSNLHVQGSALITNNITANNIYFTGQLLQNGVPFVSSGGGGSSQWTTSNTVAQTGSNSVYIVGSNIGIGTAVPQSNLDLWGTFGVTINNQKQFGISSNQLYYGYDTATIPFIYATTVNVSTTFTASNITASNITTTTINTQNNSINAGSGTILASNVGIGVTNPAGQLQVAGNTVQAYPPAAMTGYLTNLTSSGYGIGNYIASASSEYNPSANTNLAWQAFDKNLTFTAANQWSSSNGLYGSGTPSTYSTGKVYTFDTLGNSYYGEWLQIQLPVSIILSNYTLVGNNNTNNNPYKFWVLGSCDGINWTLINSQNAITWSTPWSQTFTTGTSLAFSFYRMVINQIQNAGGGSGTNPVITEWTLNATVQGITVTNDGRLGTGVVAPTRTLEIAGDLITGGTVYSITGLMYRNRFINGAMFFAQRTTSVTVPNASSIYSIDRWLQYTNTGGTGSITYSQITLSSADSGPWQLGFRYAAQVSCTSTTTNNSVNLGIIQIIEGNNFVDFNWGTSYGTPATVSFWFKSNQTGFTSFGIRNEGIFTITYTSPALVYSTANVWQYYVITVPPPPTGYSFGTGTSAAIGVYIGGCQGTQTGTSSSTGGWSTGTASFGYANQIGYITTGNSFAITGAQFEKGTVGTPFEFRPIGTELELCQRYFEVILDTSPTNTAWAMGTFSGGTANNLWFDYKIQKRIVPTIYSGSVTVPQGTLTQTLIATNYISFTVAADGTGKFYFNIGSIPLSVNADF